MLDFLKTIALDFTVIVLAVILTQLVKNKVFGEVKDKVKAYIPFISFLIIVLYVAFVNTPASFTDGVRVTIGYWLCSLGLYNAFKVIVKEKK